MSDLERAPRLDAGDVCRRVLAAGGPDLEPVRLLGGEVGAWLVRDRGTGVEAVLGWAPPLRDGDPGGDIHRRIALSRVAKGVGIPVPLVLEVVVLPEGDVAVLHELARAVPLPLDAVPSTRLVNGCLDLVERRRELLRHHPLLLPEPPSLHLLADGPGFAMHGSLAAHSDRARRVLDAVRQVGTDDGDLLRGDDLVHFDFHFENVLVDPDDPERVAAVVDWDGARQGNVAVDLAVLALDLNRRDPGSATAQRVETVLSNTTPAALARSVWAHVSLRTVDWAIRHHTDGDVEWWLAEAERHLRLAN